MTEQELINAICDKSNKYAMMTGLYTANVAYVPSKWKPLYLSEAWQIINGNHVLLNMITVFFKPFSHDNIFVNYMENPSDEMRNIPLADERIKQRSFIKIGRFRIDVADIVSYHVQSHEELYIKLRYDKDSECIRETPTIIKQAVIDLDKYFNVQTIL
jgi:hypothetical protein